MTIYIDVVLIENLIMNSIILLATGLILKEKIKIIKVLLASLLGASYSLVSYMSILEIYSSMFLKIILSIVIVYIAFNPQTIKKILFNFFCIWWCSICLNLYCKATRNINEKWTIFRNVSIQNDYFRSHYCFYYHYGSFYSRKI